MAQAYKVGLVSSLAFAEGAAQGEPVVEIVLRAGGQDTARLSVHAGMYSSEWSVDHPRNKMAHGRTGVGTLLGHAR